MECGSADRVGEKIVDVLRAELASGTSPLECFAGQMLAMHVFLLTADGLAKPEELEMVATAIDVCLASMLSERGNAGEGSR